MKPLAGSAPDDHPQHGGDHEQVERELGREPCKLLQRRRRPAQSEAQDQRRHHGDADGVPDQQRAGRDQDIGQLQLIVGEQQQGQDQGDDRGAGHSHGQKPEHIAQAVEAHVQPQVLARDKGDCPVTARDDGGNAKDDGPIQAAPEHHEFGNENACEQHDRITHTAQDHERNHGAETRIPRGHRQALVFVDEADPFEFDIGGEPAQTDEQLPREHIALGPHRGGKRPDVGGCALDAADRFHVRSLARPRLRLGFCPRTVHSTAFSLPLASGQSVAQAQNQDNAVQAPK